MKVHYLQHVPFEGLGAIESWIINKGHTLTKTALYDTTPVFPKTNEFDLLIILGGPMSVNDEDVYPWLKPEKDFIRSTIEAEKKILGICLGAQLIANTLGAKVYPNREKEIGWFPIYPEYGAVTALSFPNALNVFHWHGETFDLPPGAQKLAYSDGCTNQAYRIGEKIYALQCHLETNKELLTKMLEHGSNELTEGLYIHPVEEILENFERYSGEAQGYIFSLLDRLAAA